MEVKCPKCRYRYEAEAPSGVTEVACVCPRCGLPFSYVIPREEPSLAPDGHIPSSVVGSDALQPDLQKGPNSTIDKAQSQAEKGLTASLKGLNRDAAKHLAGSQPTHVYPFNGPVIRRRRGRCSCTGCLLALAIIVFVAVIALRGCGEERSYTGEGVTQGQVASAFLKNAKAIDKDAKAEDARPVPAWVFGTWQQKSMAGVLEIRVAGRWVRRTLGKKTLHGTFFYTPGQLNCRFYEDRKWVKKWYKLDEGLRRILTEKGFKMKKVSDH